MFYRQLNIVRQGYKKAAKRAFFAVFLKKIIFYCGILLFWQ